MEEKSRAVGIVESEETFNDYEFSPVPDEKKNTWKAQVFVWLGVGFCLTAFTLGGQIALGLGFWPTVAAVLVGGIILTVVGALVGAIGVRSGLSSTVSSRFTFGTYGCDHFRTDQLPCATSAGSAISARFSAAALPACSNWRQVST